MRLWCELRQYPKKRLVFSLAWSAGLSEVSRPAMMIEKVEIRRISEWSVRFGRPGQQGCIYSGNIQDDRCGRISCCSWWWQLKQSPDSNYQCALLLYVGRLENNTSWRDNSVISARHCRAVSVELWLPRYIAVWWSQSRCFEAVSAMYSRDDLLAMTVHILCRVLVLQSAKYKHTCMAWHIKKFSY